MWTPVLIPIQLNTIFWNSYLSSDLTSNLLVLNQIQLFGNFMETISRSNPNVNKLILFILICFRIKILQVKIINRYYFLCTECSKYAKINTEYIEYRIYREKLLIWKGVHKACVSVFFNELFCQHFIIVRTELLYKCMTSFMSFTIRSLSFSLTLLSLNFQFQCFLLALKKLHIGAFDTGLCTTSANCVYKEKRCVYVVKNERKT